MEVSTVRDTFHVCVEYNMEDEEYGPYYLASCVELSIVIDGRTLDELLENIREAIALHLQGMGAAAQYNFAEYPRVMIMVMVDL